MTYTIASTRDETDRFWASLAIDPRVRPAVEAEARKILALKPIYRQVERLSGRPWFAIGLIYMREASSSVYEKGPLKGQPDCHLHNGDPLDNWTTHDPVRRPGKGSPTFLFIESALDAISIDPMLRSNSDWSIAGCAQTFEEFNGEGYREHGHIDPYNWAWSNHSVAGKYTADHHFDPTARDLQPGCMTVLSVLMELDPTIRIGGLVTAGAQSAPSLAGKVSGACTARAPTVIDAIATHPASLRVALGTAAPLAPLFGSLSLPSWLLSPVILGGITGAALVAAVWGASEIIGHFRKLRRASPVV